LYGEWPRRSDCRRRTPACPERARSHRGLRPRPAAYPVRRPKSRAHRAAGAQFGAQFSTVRTTPTVSPVPADLGLATPRTSLNAGEWNWKSCWVLKPRGFESRILRCDAWGIPRPVRGRPETSRANDLSATRVPVPSTHRSELLRLDDRSSHRNEYPSASRLAPIQRRPVVSAQRCIRHSRLSRRSQCWLRWRPWSDLPAERGCGVCWVIAVTGVVL
jgi:hypothetical protein